MAQSVKEGLEPAILLLLQIAGSSMVAAQGFVTRSGTSFYDANGRFIVQGCNFYPAMSLASNSNNRPQVANLLATASSLGLNVVRTWAFGDGPGQLQTAPGQYNEQWFQGLDYVIAQAAQNNLRVILPFVNNWSRNCPDRSDALVLLKDGVNFLLTSLSSSNFRSNYGGKDRYVQWSQQARAGGSNPDDFYSNDYTRDLYRKFVSAVINRQNTFTGIYYKNDPTIFAWELMNEPRCESDPSGDTLQNWLQEMASYVKSIDGNHLLSTGTEGFYGPSTTARHFLNPGGWAANTGEDWMRNHRIDQIDFATFHSYPDQWMGGTIDDQLAFLANWTRGHVYDGSADRLNKPVVMGEFGAPMSSQRTQDEFSNRNRFFQIVYQSVLNGGANAGVIFWQLNVAQNVPQSPNKYAVYCPADSSTVNIISQQSAAVRGRRCK
ncbi:hypothetical protein KFL_001310095 [Klebsormidium nitens]|uniref:mannan endo-1,4-beta-mannosidase n=1 Tax=Klebsormidium nitens TaxID=105231 RepID=A0A1Y1I0L2_KLENI|nr:hypothetical protein KFL_001310095 [Klebsormidium nitens]|eukprot:GAQ82979.1 hypothetical protein KFL_001310095 [Klebsormidium nitens]